MKSKDLTPNETCVLSIIHKLGEADALDILKHVKNDKNWVVSNIDSFLIQLYSKGYVSREKKNRRYCYTAKLSLIDVVCNIFDNLFQGLFRDQPDPLLNYLVQTKKLTKREIEILKVIISSEDEKENEHNEENDREEESKEKNIDI